MSKAEFRHGVMRLNVGATLEEVNSLFDKFDADHSGAISRVELLNQIKASKQFAGASRPPARDDHSEVLVELGIAHRREALEELG